MLKKTHRNKKPLTQSKPVSKKSAAVAKDTQKQTICLGLHNLKAPAGSHKKRKIKGRGPGSGHGKTSTRGSKGQTSRAGRATYLGFEGGQMPLIRKIPKRGFTNRDRVEYQIVNLHSLSQIKELAVTPELLKKEGLIEDQNKRVKILGDGEIKNPFNIRAHAFSKKAADKIKSAGGTFEVIHV